MKLTEMKIELENVKKKNNLKSRSKINTKSNKKHEVEEKKFQHQVESATECIDCGLTMGGLRAMTCEITTRPS